MHIRFHMDPETGQPHIFEHGVTEEEVRQILVGRGDDFRGARQRIRYHGLRPEGQGAQGLSPAATEETQMKKPATTPKTRKRVQRKFPRGWNEKRVQNVIAYYDRQTEDEELAEYEAGMSVEGFTVMVVPTKLVPEIRQLIGRRRGA